MGLKRYNTPSQRYTAAKKNVRFYQDTKKVEGLTRQLLALESSPDVQKTVQEFFQYRRLHRASQQKVMKLLYQYGVLSVMDEFDIIG